MNISSINRALNKEIHFIEIFRASRKMIRNFKRQIWQKKKQSLVENKKSIAISIFMQNTRYYTNILQKSSNYPLESTQTQTALSYFVIKSN